MAEPEEDMRAPEPVERFVKQLLVTYKAVKLYPPGSDIPRENARDALLLLRYLLRERADIRFYVLKDGLVVDGGRVLPGRSAFDEFGREFYSHGVAEVRFHTGISERELTEFFAVLKDSPQNVLSAGGFEARMWERQIDNITVREANTKIVDAAVHQEDLDESPDEKWPPSNDVIDAIMERGHLARPRDQRLLVRFVQSPRLVGRYLQETAHGRGAEVSMSRLATVVTEFARLAGGELAEDQPILQRSVAEAVMGLEPSTRQRLLANHLLEEARVDDAVAGILRQLDLGEVCRALVTVLSEDPVSQEGLSRAIRNLAAISLAGREDVLTAAKKAMQDAGVSMSATAAVLEDAAPTTLQAQSNERPAAQEELASILRLVDLAPQERNAEDADEDVVALKTEVVRGVSDGDILSTLVSIASLERRPDTFASLLALVEDNLALLIEWGEFEAATHVASVLVALEADETLVPEQRMRVRTAIGALASPRAMYLVNQAIRVYETGTPEHESSRRFLEVLGGHAIPPLLEALADEPDMAGRKSLVDLLSGFAGNHVERLGSHVTDGRWYFVRNVVSILGATRSSAVLPYLNRTIRHADVRVRRETIRALSGIRDRMAEEMLVSALSDQDEQNVRLAARYLGTMSARGAVRALSIVAKGEGRGNRDIGPRVEAIEALGKIGDLSAKPVLESLAKQRGLMRSGRSREVRTAAEFALVTLTSGRSRTSTGEGAS
ncbi:MAG: HEAT repeat domain-containing protein [Coriobacteriia bacterium]|nr:HEAT repeat domain-containing protein [Coriobacteriia bacterium]MBN2822204.1 HEAT repeat domain-containing protein [Coriobacteriia bacterium]